MVHGRPRYMSGWTPRVNGNVPGTPMSVSESVSARSTGAAKVRVSGRVAIDAEILQGPGLHTIAVSPRSRRVICSRRTRENGPKNGRIVDTLQWCLYNADSLLRRAKPLYLKPLAPDPCWSPRPGRFGSGNDPDPGPAAVRREQEWMTS